MTGKFAKYILTNGISSAEIVPFGATLTSLKVPNKYGELTEVVLGYYDFTMYETTNSYFGATIGRVGNRIANAQFTLDGVVYKLPANDNGNCLHGGFNGFDKCTFTVEENTTDSILLSYLSKDGEQGFPGNLQIKVRYTLSHNNTLEIEYFAETDKVTVFSPTNHSFFNLNGRENATENSIYNHVLQIKAASFLEINDKLIPTGERLAVAGAFDFSAPKAIGDDIDTHNNMLKLAGGYDHNYCLCNKKYEQIAFASSVDTGITMQVFTDLSGVQFYSGNFLDGSNGYARRSGFCLETQDYPNSCNSNIDSVKLSTNQKYYSKTGYKFLIDGEKQ